MLVGLPVQTALPTAAQDQILFFLLLHQQEAVVVQEYLVLLLELMAGQAGVVGREVALGRATLQVPLPVKGRMAV